MAKKSSKISKSIALQDKINDLHSQGKGYLAISTELKKEGYDLSHMSIKRYLDTTKDTKSEVLNSDNSIANYVKERIFDTGEQLKKANQVLWGLIEEAKVSKTFKLSVLKEIRGTIKLADELMNDFKGIKIDQGPKSKVQLIQVIINKLQDLEKTGEIKIINPKLREDEKTKEKVIINAKDEYDEETPNEGEEHNNIE